MTITNTSIEFEFPALKEAQEKIDAKSKALHDVFAEAGEDVDLSKVKSVAGGKDAVLAFIRDTNTELEDLGKERDGLLEVAKAAKVAASYDPELPGTETGDDRDRNRGTKSIGQLFAESKSRTEKGTPDELDIELKTLFETTAGWAPETTRGPRVVFSAERPIQVIDLIPQTTTTQTAITYMEETTFTNNAAETAEGGAYGEAALVLTEKSDSVRKIGVWLPVTDEQLEDVPRIQSYLDNRLPFMVRQRLDLQLLVGDGTPPNISGIQDRSGIQTQAKGADPTPDAVYKAMTKVRVTGQALPNAYVTHPNDWQEVRLLRTVDGIYIWGNPSEAGPERIWGLMVVQAQAETENTGLVGDFANFTELAVKRGIETKVTDSHSDFFVKGKQAIRADIRAALAVYRPAAFATVTGV